MKYNGANGGILRMFLHLGSRRYLSSKLNDVAIDKIRNIGIIAHIDAGKTTTTERMLYFSGKTSRIGNVDEGDTVTDFLPSERRRGITIQSAAITIPWNNRKINIIDTPGHADFTFEVIRSLRVLDGAVTILDAVAGVEAQTEKVWKQAQSLNIPKIAFINKMDRPGAGFSRTVKEIVQKLQTRVVLVNIPYFDVTKSNDPVFKGVIDIIHKRAYVWDMDSNSSGKDIKVIDIEKNALDYPDIFDMLQKSRESMIETLGEFDETIIDSFLENDENYMNVPSAILISAIKKTSLNNDVTPILCGASFRNIGVQPLMDAIIDYLPSPLQAMIPKVTSSKNIQKYKSKKQNIYQNSQIVDLPVTLNKNQGLVINKNPNLTLLLAFKVMTHSTKGVMTFFRVYSGKVVSNSTMINTRTGKHLQVKKLMLMHGDEPEEVKQISAGNIGVVIGHEDDIFTGDTLVTNGPKSKKTFDQIESNIKLLPIEIPPPLFNTAIEPLSAGDERYMNECIKTLIREDPSLVVEFDEDLGQTILKGMGELHLDIVRERLINDMKAKVRLREVAVSYKESLTGSKIHQISEVNEEAQIKLEIELESFEGNAMETTYSEEEGAIIIEQDNNIIIFEPTATSTTIKDAIDQRRWKCEETVDDLQHAIIQGCLTALQMGGPMFGLSLNSMVVRIKHWDFPADQLSITSSMLTRFCRQIINNYIQQCNASSFCILEPIMEVKIYVNADSLGEVTHDLSQRCQAIITSIEDEANENLDDQSWANAESERIYLPPDYTNKSGTITSIQNKKVIVAQTPLYEMIGYLSRLRSITQGRGTFDMSYLGMRRASKAREATIAAK